MENKLEHLKLVQGVISRLAGNSFQLKGWSVTLIAAVFAVVASKPNNYVIVFIAYLPVLMFWGLDGYFLWQERLYRRLYDQVRNKGNNAETDFSMDVGNLVAGTPGWLSTCLSVTLGSFYGVMLLIIIVMTIIIMVKLR